MEKRIIRLRRFFSGAIDLPLVAFIFMLAVGYSFGPGGIDVGAAALSAANDRSESQQPAYSSRLLNPSALNTRIPDSARQKIGKLQVPFVQNQGQTDEKVKFYASTFGGTVYVTKKGEVVYSLPETTEKKGVVLSETLVGGREPTIEGAGQALTRVNSFRGNDSSKWQRNISTYDAVSLREVYRGIDLKLKAHGNTVEKLFYVRDGADPEQIKLKLQGGKSLTISEAGELEVETALGTVKFSKPVAYQEESGKREFVEVAYAVNGDEYGFNVGAYDKTRELVIDPILAATFLGGSNEEFARAIALDATGNVYVAGETGSTDFPGMGAGSADSTYVLGEAFVAKLNSDLSRILAATFLGGSSGDFAAALTLDTSGNVYVAGRTGSSDFPGVGAGSAISSFLGGARTGFIVKLNSNLSSIVAATFMWRDQNTQLQIAVDATGNVYVAGETPFSGFPGVGLGSADSSAAGRSEGFVAKLDSNLSAILAATYLGGSGAEFVRTLAVDATGNVYVAGRTQSYDFPGVGLGSADSTFAGSEDGFIAKLNSGLTTILAATFLAGGNLKALALDGTGNVYVAGEVFSSDFPGVGAGSADSTFAGLSEGFVAKLNSNLSAILAATFLGGSGFYEVVSSVALDTKGNVYVAGSTGSPDFPGIGAGSADNSIEGSSPDGYVAKLNSDLSKVLAATFLGGWQGGYVTALALDVTGNVYVTGFTESRNFPGVGVGSADSTSVGDDESFVVKLTLHVPAGGFNVNSLVTFAPQSSTFRTVTNTAGCPAGFVGKFTFTARLTNKSSSPALPGLEVAVQALTNGNLLLNPQSNELLGGVRANISIPEIGKYSDGLLSASEWVDVPFAICLKNRNSFQFFVDVYGLFTKLVSVNRAGTNGGNGDSNVPALSNDGRVLAFVSAAGDLVERDTNGTYDVFVRNVQTGKTTLVSVNQGGTASGNAPSGSRSATFPAQSLVRPSVSADGRFVAFASYANNLVTNDNNGKLDVFVGRAGTTTLVSVNLAGTVSGNGDSLNPVLSADGHFVVFSSEASDLVPDDNNGQSDVFVRDLLNGTTKLVSVNHAGTSGNGGSGYGHVISPDGRFVVFASYATDLVTTPVLGGPNVFVRDLRGGGITLVSVNQEGNIGGNGPSYVRSRPSDDGRFVVFESAASDLVANDNNGQFDVFVRDVQTGTTTLVSANQAGANSGNGSSEYGHAINGDGRLVAFVSAASDLVTTDTNGRNDVFVRDLETGITTLVSINRTGTNSGHSQSGNVSLSADGRFVGFFSEADDLALDTHGRGNAFVRDLRTETTTMMSVNRFGFEGGNRVSGRAVLSADGHFAAFVSAASDLVTTATSGRNDVFVRPVPW